MRLATESYGARGHLSSLNPINPLNRPDAWEAGALVKFGQGVEEVTGIAEIEGAPYLRLIRPMKMGQKCLACHVEQGYQEGDLAGGISVSVPLAPLNAAADRRISALALGHGGLWLFGVLGIGVAAWQLRRRIDERETIHQTLEEHEDRTRAILGASLDGIIAIDANDVIIDWNLQAEQTFGWPRDEALGRSLSETIIPERFHAQHAAGLKRSLENGATVLIGRRVELIGLHRDGHEFPIEISIARITVRRGALLQCLCARHQRTQDGGGQDQSGLSHAAGSGGIAGNLDAPGSLRAALAVCAGTDSLDALAGAERVRQHLPDRRGIRQPAHGRQARAVGEHRADLRHGRDGPLPVRTGGGNP